MIWVQNRVREYKPVQKNEKKKTANKSSTI